MSLYSDFKSWASRRLQQASPDTFVEGGGHSPDDWFSDYERSRETLEGFENVYKQGGPLAQLIDTRALMTFGTGSEFVSDRPEVAEWLEQQFNDRDNFFIDVGRDAYIYGDGFAEIVEARGGGFSHLELVSPKTLEAEWDDHGQIQAWTQSIKTSDGQGRTETFQPDEIAHFAIRRLGRSPLGISLVGQNKDEAERFARNQEAISHALKLHGWPKYHIKAGREGGSAINDEELRRVRRRFRNFDERTQFTTGVDIDISELDTGDIQIEGVTEHDLMVLAAGFGVPEEMAGLGRGSTEATAKVRLQAFERMARAEQRALASEFIEQVVRPILERYSPFPRDVDVGLEFDDVVSDQTATAEWLSSFKDVYTVDEMREKLGDSPHTGDDEDLGPPQPEQPAGEGGGLDILPNPNDPGAEGPTADTAEPDSIGEGRFNQAVPDGAISISDPSDAPAGANIISGPRGGLYYVPGAAGTSATGEEGPSDPKGTPTDDDTSVHAPNPAVDVPRFRESERATELIETVNAEPLQGFTLNSDLSEYEGGGYVVTLTSEVFTKEAGMTKDDVVAFYEQYATVLESHPDVSKVGGFSADEDEDYISVDLNVVLEDRTQAVTLGRGFNQMAIWDATNFEVIETGGTGEPVAEGPDAIESLLGQVLAQPDAPVEASAHAAVADGGRRLTAGPMTTGAKDSSMTQYTRSDTDEKVTAFGLYAAMRTGKWAATKHPDGTWHVTTADGETFVLEPAASTDSESDSESEE